MPQSPRKTKSVNQKVRTAKKISKSLVEFHTHPNRSGRKSTKSK